MITDLTIIYSAESYAASTKNMMQALSSVLDGESLSISTGLGIKLIHPGSG
jgi:hypothetical protein